MVYPPCSWYKPKNSIAGYPLGNLNLNEVIWDDIWVQLYIIGSNYPYTFVICKPKIDPESVDLLTESKIFSLSLWGKKSGIL